MVVRMAASLRPVTRGPSPAPPVVSPAGSTPTLPKTPAIPENYLGRRAVVWDSAGTDPAPVSRGRAAGCGILRAPVPRCHHSPLRGPVLSPLDGHAQLLWHHVLCSSRSPPPSAAVRSTRYDLVAVLVRTGRGWKDDPPSDPWRRRPRPIRPRRGPGPVRSGRVGRRARRRLGTEDDEGVSTTLQDIEPVPVPVRLGGVRGDPTSPRCGATAGGATRWPRRRSSS